MTTAVFAVCLLILPPTAPGEAERKPLPPHLTLVPSMEQCVNHKQRYEAECRARHADDGLRVPGARVVTACQERK